MSSSYTLKISEDQAREMPMVDLAFALLKSANTPFYYRDLMQEIAKIKGLSEQQMMDVIAQLYTEINIDGRFACVGTNLWGLKRWYPVEKSEDAVAGGKRPRIINDDDDDLDDDLFAEEEEERYDEETDYDAFNSIDGEESNETELYEDESVEEEELEDMDAEEAEAEDDFIDESDDADSDLDGDDDDDDK